MAVTINDKANKKNDNSPQSKEHPISSTPLRKMHNINAEESPDLDSYPSPIFPCTQEGGNEVAWDWQSSLNKTPESRNNKQNIQFETPKRTKLLQRKRNSNSPLLYKPHKRKTIKMENIENIGQFAAELQALDEKVRFIKQTDNKNPSGLMEEKPPILANMNSEEEIARIPNEEQNCIEKVDNHDNIGKNDASESYDDLFDDSIDDSMARCTQEIEEKFNLITDKGNSPHSQTDIKKEEELPSKSNETFSVQSTFNEHIKEHLTRNFLPKSISDSNTLKTYSKLSSKRDVNSSIHISVQKENLHKSHLNNNNMIRSHIEKSCDNTRLPKCNIAELFDIPDDSFDDCLATCIEDEKLLSPTGSNDFSSCRNDNAKYEAKHLIHASLKSEVKPSTSLKTAAKDETSSSIFLENRKFFKTKSLSDQYIGQDAVAGTKNTSNTSSASCFTTKPKLYWNTSKNMHTNVTRDPVSNNPIVTNDNKVEDTVISLMRETNRTHGSDVNRYAVKEGGDRFGRYNSTGNMRNDTKETTRSGTQLIQCTAEEIEQKRLQAKMRLEARRKIYSLKIINNINIR